MTRVFLLLTALLFLGSLHTAADAAELQADPSDYVTKITQLQPGDTLVLAAGEYNSGLYLSMRGTAAAWITIRSADADDPAVFLGRDCCNTAELVDCSYVALESLKFDGQNRPDVFAISANGDNNLTHHIRIERCTITNHGGTQQSVGISSKCATWGWVIRGNTIVGAGTGMYLGDSNGTRPFVGGLIENNRVYDSEGYCLQIKHQYDRPSVTGMPTGPQVTVIRHNVFIKTDRPNEDGARPNLLLGSFPQSGAGSQDRYEVYGNFFCHNPREYLMQAEGRVSIHDNVFVDSAFGAIHLGDHYQELRQAYVYNNTIYGVVTGIYIDSTPQQGSACVGNVVFADTPLSGAQIWDRLEDNVADTVAAATTFVTNPSLTLGQMDLYPKAGQLQGTALDLSAFAGDLEYDLDFNGEGKGGRTYRGAYAGQGANPGWQLDNALKGMQPAPPPPPPVDETPPTGSIAVVGGAATTADTSVDLDVSASDAVGTVTTMCFSNDGATWSVPEPYATTRASWDLAAFGGNATPGQKTIHARFSDDSDNWSTVSITTTVELVSAGDDPVPPPAPSSGAVGGLETLVLALLALCAYRSRSRS